MASPGDTGFVASLELWPLNWAPRDWAICNGALMEIEEHTTLFALLGTTYGGNGISNFALPDMRDRVPMGAFGNRYVGQYGGYQSIRLPELYMPSHTHVATASGKQKAFTGKGTLVSDPTNNYFGAPSTAIYGSTPNTDMGDIPVTVNVEGAGGVRHLS